MYLDVKYVQHASVVIKGVSLLSDKDQNSDLKWQGQ